MKKIRFEREIQAEVRTRLQNKTGNERLDTNKVNVEHKSLNWPGQKLTPMIVFAVWEGHRRRCMYILPSAGLLLYCHIVASTEPPNYPSSSMPLLIANQNSVLIGKPRTLPEAATAVSCQSITLQEQGNGKQAPNICLTADTVHWTVFSSSI